MSNKIYTIGREFGSGGKAVGEALANRLGIKLYDKELLQQAAKDSGFCEEIFENHDEKPTSSFLYSLVMDTYSVGSYNSSPFLDMPLNHKVFLAQFETIKKIADRESCVIVGRCADYVLRNQERVLRCYLYAPDAYRASSVASLNLSTASEYQPLIDEVDKARASYYLKYTGYPVDNLELRDLVVNTACLGLEGTVEMLAAFAAKKFGLNLEEQA